MLFRNSLLLLICALLFTTQCFALPAPDSYCEGSACGHFEGVCSFKRKASFPTVPSYCSKRGDGTFEIWCKIENGCTTSFNKTKDCDSADCKVYVNLARDCAAKASAYPTFYYKPVISSFRSWEDCERSRVSNAASCRSNIPPFNPPEPYEGCYAKGLTKPQESIDMSTPCERPNTSLTAVCVAEQTTAY